MSPVISAKSIFLVGVSHSIQALEMSLALAARNHNSALSNN